MSTDAIVILKDDHKKIRRLFRDFQQASKGARTARGKLVDQIIEELMVHTHLENEIMYPAVRSAIPDLTDDVLESYEEHHVADVLCTELAGMDPNDENFDAKATVLIESMTRHIDSEEQDWFPKVREGLGRKELQTLGEAMIAKRDEAPRRPAQPSVLKKAVDAVIS